MKVIRSHRGKVFQSNKMSQDWEKARDWLKQKSITRMSAKVDKLAEVSS